MKDGRNLIIAGLLVAIIAMAVGYSAFASQLQINGKATITGSWDVEITKIEATTVTGLADAGEPSFTTSSATFDAKLKQPGDSVTYTVTIENKGSIDAVLKQATQWTEQTNGCPEITYTTTEPAAALNAGATTTLTVTATYNADATEVPEVLSKTITGVIDYIQAPTV